MILISLILGMDPGSAAAVIGVLIAIFTMVGTIIFRAFSAEGLSGQLAAKDAVIATNHQTIEAFEGRISTLENRLSEVIDELARAHGVAEELRRQTVAWELRYMSLRDFVVPASLTRLIEVLQEERDHNPKVNDLLEDLTRAKNKYDALQLGRPAK